jgi:hypothetical protein
MLSRLYDEDLIKDTCKEKTTTVFMEEIKDDAAHRGECKNYY